MGSARSDRAQSFTRAIVALLLAAALVLAPIFAAFTDAFATAPTDEVPDLELIDEVEDGEGEAEEGSIPEAGTNTTNPIKPRPKVEITTDVVAIEPVTDASIEEEGTPLGAFDFETCMFHLIMLAGIVVTLGYTAFAFYRTQKHTNRLNRTLADLTNGVVRSADVAPSVKGAVASGATPAPADN